MDYQLLVIGGGPGGYTAAIRAAQLGLKTALVEKDRLGGVCLNNGCIPTKSWIACAERLRAVQGAAAFGVTAEQVSFDLKKIVKRKNELVTRLRGGVSLLLRKNGVTVIKGEAVFVDAHTVAVGEQRFSAEKIIIASGSLPKELPFAPFGGLVVDSDYLLDLPAVPPRLLVIGGGVMGLEFAGVLQSLGSQVTVVELAERLLPFADQDLSSELTRLWQKRGLEIVTGARVTAIAQSGERATVRLERADGQVEEREAELVLATTGRRPCLEGLALGKAGVAYTERGIAVDEQLLTSQRHIAAIGDVLGGVQLAHFAAAQGLTAAAVLSGQTPTVDLSVIPACIFTDPEIASVGLTEQQAQAAGLAYQMARFPLAACGKAVVVGQPEGFVKLIYTPQGQLLGLHILGAHASDLIGEGALALTQKLGLAALENTIHPHPTLCESLQEAAHLAAGYPVNIPK